MLMALAVPVVLVQVLPVANLSGQPLRSRRFGGDVHSGATCGDTHAQWSGAGQWLEGVRYGFLKKQGGTWEEKVGTWVEKGANLLRLWRAAWVIRLQAGVMWAEAVLTESSAMFTDRGGVMIFFRFCCIPFGPCGLFRLACSCKRHARRSFHEE